MDSGSGTRPASEAIPMRTLIADGLSARRLPVLLMAAFGGVCLGYAPRARLVREGEPREQADSAPEETPHGER